MPHLARLRSILWTITNMHDVPVWLYFVGFLLVLGPLVFVHEYGHYIVGRWCGVKADAFSIGFGRKVIGWTDKRGTEWKIGWLPLGGLALANTAATAVESLALLMIMRRRLRGLGGRQILRTGLLALAASAAMGLALFVWLFLTGGQSKYITLIGGVGIGVAVYAAALWLLKVPEFRAIVRRIKGKLAAKG